MSSIIDSLYPIFSQFSCLVSGGHYRSKKSFWKNPLVLLKKAIENIHKPLCDREVYKHLTLGNKKDEQKAFFDAWKPGEPLNPVQIKCIRDLIDGINDRIKKDFGISMFFIYQDEDIFINPEILK